MHEELSEGIKMLNDAHFTEEREMHHKINSLELENRRLSELLSTSQAKLNRRTITEHKNIQVSLDMEERDNVHSDEIKSYYENINYFILGGKLKSIEWVTFLITDIFSSKFKADFHDLRSG